MMASAASWLPSRDSLETSCGTPVSNGAVGSCTPMTPVDATKTSSAGMQSAWAAIDCMACAAARPGSPVAALAMPEFKMTARALPPAATARRDLHWRSAEHVFRERAGSDGALRRRDDERGIEALGVLPKPDMRSGSREAFRSGDAAIDELVPCCIVSHAYLANRRARCGAIYRQMQVGPLRALPVAYSATNSH